MTREAYSMYETGRRQPPNETLVKLAGHYRVSLDFLAGRTDIPFSFAGLPPKLREAVIQLFELEEENLEVVLSVIRLAHGRGSSR